MTFRKLIERHARRDSQDHTADFARRCLDHSDWEGDCPSGVALALRSDKWEEHLQDENALLDLMCDFAEAKKEEEAPKWRLN